LSPVNIVEIRLGVDLLKAGPLKQRATAALHRLRRKMRAWCSTAMSSTAGRIPSIRAAPGREIASTTERWPSRGLVRTVQLATGSPARVDLCRAADRTRDGSVRIEAVVRAANRAL
jgi:hypothetical protein